MSAEVWYADSSAIVKTIIAEPETGSLRRWLAEPRQLAACEVIRIEVVRAVRIADPEAVSAAWVAVADVSLIRLEPELQERAALIDPASLRSLDAIHLAAALSLGPRLAGVLTYDLRMAGGARLLGLPVASPGRR
jgi:predicted nucleic acid-binding protein